MLINTMSAVVSKDLPQKRKNKERYIYIHTHTKTNYTPINPLKPVLTEYCF